MPGTWPPRGEYGIDFVSTTEAVLSGILKVPSFGRFGTSTPAGRMVLTSLAAIAELERELIRERVCSRLAAGTVC